MLQLAEIHALADAVGVLLDAGADPEHGGVFHVISYLVGTLPIRLFFKERNTFSYYAYVFVFSVPILILNAACSLLDLLDRDPELTLNYECIYEKRK